MNLAGHTLTMEYPRGFRFVDAAVCVCIFFTGGVCMGGVVSGWGSLRVASIDQLRTVTNLGNPTV